MTRRVQLTKAISLYSFNELSGIVLKAEIVGIEIATDNEYCIYLHLRGGSKVCYYVDGEPEEINSEFARIISELGWS